jgi:hypothetical protein
VKDWEVKLHLISSESSLSKTLNQALKLEAQRRQPDHQWG